MTGLEFWPDYGRGPVWTDSGQAVDLDALGLDPELATELSAWNAAYDEDHVLPREPVG